MLRSVWRGLSTASAAALRRPQAGAEAAVGFSMMQRARPVVPVEVQPKGPTPLPLLRVPGLPTYLGESKAPARNSVSSMSTLSLLCTTSMASWLMLGD
jgi:hypothetical protein